MDSLRLFSIVNIMNSHSINQLVRFKKLLAKYGHYERVGNIYIFRCKGGKSVYLFLIDDWELR
jgi:hypothetical protein